MASLSKLNNTVGASSRQGLLDHGSSKNSHGRSSSLSAKSAKSEFALRASAISKEIGETTAMLQRLALLAKRKTLFDDRPVEISELTFVIKQKVSKVNQNIASLQQYVKSAKLGEVSDSGWGGGNKKKSEAQLAEHSNNVVVLLQGKLSEVTTGFEEVLEVRIKNIQASKNRTEQFISSASSSVKDASNINPDSPLYAASRSRTPLAPPPGASTRASYNSTPVGASENPYASSAFTDESYKSGGQDYLALPEQQQTLVLLEEQQDTYLSQRGSAVETIESTIQELGGIFAQLATMVAEQRETIQRIDADTEDISLNVSGAQRELLKYYSRISSNRWLLIKSFGVIIVSISTSDISALSNISALLLYLGSCQLVARPANLHCLIIFAFQYTSSNKNKPHALTEYEISG